MNKNDTFKLFTVILVVACRIYILVLPKTKPPTIRPPDMPYRRDDLAHGTF